MGQGFIPEDARAAGPAPVSPPRSSTAARDEIVGLLDSTLKTRDDVRLIDGTGKAGLFDGRSGEPFPEPVSVGYMYILKGSTTSSTTRSTPARPARTR